MATVGALRNRKDIELMKTVLKDRNPRYYLLFVIGVNTGLRIGDLLRLKMNDFISEKGSFHKHLIVVEKKTGKKREIAINGTIQKALKTFISSCNPLDGGIICL